MRAAVVASLLLLQAGCADDSGGSTAPPAAAHHVEPSKPTSTPTPTPTPKLSGRDHPELPAEQDKIPLWPMNGDIVEIPVCWAASRIDPKRYPNEAWAWSAVPLAEKQQWVREVAESELEARTPIRFVGWESCESVDATRFVQLVPIDSLNVTCDEDLPGRSCIFGLGALARGKEMLLNLAAVDEFLYHATHELALERGEADASDAMATTPSGRYTWWCSDVRYDNFWQLDEPPTVAKVHAAYKRCIQNTALHELGHAAGFGHEQKRTDYPEERAACMEKIDTKNDEGASRPDPRVNWPTRPFDAESIMSYCREDTAPVLTELDVARAKLTYPPR